MRLPHALPTLAALLAGCSQSPRSSKCGFAALTGPLAVKEAFGEGNVLTNVPEAMPPHTVVRLVAGPAWTGSVAHDSTGGWLVRTAAKEARDPQIGYGVLVLDNQDAVLGVLAFDGRVVRGATHLGTLAIADTIVPLIGVRIAASAIQDPQCPLFPDSLR